MGTGRPSRPMELRVTLADGSTFVADQKSVASILRLTLYGGELSRGNQSQNQASQPQGVQASRRRRARAPVPISRHRRAA